MKIGVMLRHMGEQGGIAVYTKNLLNALFEIDRKNEYVMIYRCREQLGGLSLGPNVREEILPARTKLWWDQVSVPRFAAKERLDLVFSPKMAVPMFGSTKSVTTIHGGEQFVVPSAFRWYDRLYFSIANRLYCKKASGVITMTRQGATDIHCYMGCDPNKLHVIYESYNEKCRAWDTEAAEAVRRRYSLPERFILFVGGLTPLKNLANVLRAFRKAIEVVPHKLVIVGFHRWKFENDIKMMQDLGLRDRLVTPGFVPDEDLPGFYNLASLFMLPSLYEGFGMPVLEAMACGCPVITSNVGCSPEVSGNAAYLVDPYSPDAIADAIVRVLTDDVTRKDLIKKGMARAGDFSWRRCATETLRLFESLQTQTAVERRTGFAVK